MDRICENCGIRLASEAEGSDLVCDKCWDLNSRRVHKNNSWYWCSRSIYLQDCTYVLRSSYLSPSKSLKLKRCIVIDLEGDYWELTENEPYRKGDEVKARAHKTDRVRATSVLIESLKREGEDVFELEYDPQYFDVFDDPLKGLNELKRRGYSHYVIERGYYTPWCFYYALIERRGQLYWEATIYYDEPLKKWLIEKRGPHKVENADCIKVIQ